MWKSTRRSKAQNFRRAERIPKPPFGDRHRLQEPGRAAEHECRGLETASSAARRPFGAQSQKDELYGKSVVVIGSNLTPRLQRWLKEGFDIISPAWVIESIRVKRLLPIEPGFIVGSENPKLVKRSAHNVDQFGDSYLVSGNCPKGFFYTLPISTFRGSLSPRASPSAGRSSSLVKAHGGTAFSAG